MPTDCDQFTTLDCLRALYNFNYTLVVPDQHSIGIGASIAKSLCRLDMGPHGALAVEFGMETLNLADLNTFFQDYAPALVGKQPTFVSIDGGESA